VRPEDGRHALWAHDVEGLENRHFLGEAAHPHLRAVAGAALDEVNA
jgi:hypothetical protein